MFNPKGQIYLLNLAKSDHIEEALNILSGNFLTATSCQTDKTDICVVSNLYCFVNYIFTLPLRAAVCMFLLTSVLKGGWSSAAVVL